MFGYRKSFIHSCGYCAQRPQLEPIRWRQQLNDYCRVDIADQWICGQVWLERTGWICTQHVRKTTVFYHHTDKQRQRILVRGTLSRGCSIECHWCSARYGYDTRFWLVRLLWGSFVGDITWVCPRHTPRKVEHRCLLLHHTVPESRYSLEL